VFIATTAGDDEHGICAEVHRHAQQVRDGVVDDPQLLPLIYAAPAEADWHDEAVWRLCNPALGSFRSLEEMQAAARQAKDVPGREAPFRRFYLNQWGTASAERWLPLAAWDACRIDSGSEINSTGLPRPTLLGLDLSTTTDLSALAIVVPTEEGAYQVRMEFWCPADSIAERSRRDHVPYALWVE
jgi:phage terminase large subunit-like protein